MTKKILIVDDESSIREALSKVFQAEGYEVSVAENGQEAIEKLLLDKNDLMLLDLGLPVKDGREILIWLAEINPLLPVIVITGRNNQRELAENMGADALMEKPLDVPHLLQTIRELINEPKDVNTRHTIQHRLKFRYVPNENELFRQTLLKQLTTPYLCPGLKDIHPRRHEPKSNN